MGPGDSGKSTVLDAIDLCLGARRNVQFSDADFFDLDITNPISITLTLGDLDDAMRTLEGFGAFLRGYHPTTGVVKIAIGRHFHLQMFDNRGMIGPGRRT